MMKFNFNIDLALIITILTSFLFWCGYWYQYGYTEFFGISISFIDISIPIILIDGLIVASNQFFILLLILLLFSFMTGYSRKDIEFFFNVFSSFIAFIFMACRYKLYDSGKRKYKLLNASLNIPYLPKRKVQKKSYSVHHFQSSSFIFASEYLKKHKMTFSHNVKLIYGEGSIINGKNTTFRILLYYMILLILLFGTVILFNAGKQLQISGWESAKNDFELSFKIKTPNKNTPYFQTFSPFKESNKMSTFLITNICNKESCIAIDAQRNVRIIGLKNIEINKKPQK